MPFGSLAIIKDWPTFDAAANCYLGGSAPKPPKYLNIINKFNHNKYL